MLQSNFHFIVRQSRLWFREDMRTIMQCCFILRNRMVEQREIIGEGIRSSAADVTVGLTAADCFSRAEEYLQEALQIFTQLVSSSKMDKNTLKIAAW